MKDYSEELHKETARSSDLRNRLIAMEVERNNILAALIDEGLETLSRVLTKAAMNNETEVGLKLLKITHRGDAYRRNP